MLNRIIHIFNTYNIRYFLANGNLLEFTRGKLIQQDDDIDIRIHNDDLPNWMEYCLTLARLNNKYMDYHNVLVFDNRAHDMKKQIYNGIQVVLNVPNVSNKKLNVLHQIYKNQFKDGIHMDIVPAQCGFSSYWKTQSYVFQEPLRKVSYLNSLVCVPSAKMTDKVLTQDYGKDYLIPI